MPQILNLGPFDVVCFSSALESSPSAICLYYPTNCLKICMKKSVQLDELDAFFPY